MARVTVFSYKPGTTLLHRLDPRFKLLFMVMLSLGSLNTSFRGLFVASVLVCASLVAAQVNFTACFKELKIFPFFLFFIFIARALSTPGEAIFEFYGVSPTYQGILIGLQLCWRLLLIVLVSLGLIISTTTSEIKSGIECFFAKVPLAPEKRISTMLSLMVRFIPIILNQVQETLDAQKARCVELRKNPITRLVKLTIPVMRRIFHNGDQLSIAMTSRCYTEDRTSPVLVSSNLDWICLTAISFLVILMQLL